MSTTPGTAPTMTLREAAQAALSAQDASNLSGVVLTFSRVLAEALWPEARRLAKGTDWVNQHPVSKAFADKIAALAGIESSHLTSYLTACHALADCLEIAKGERDGA